MRVVTHLTFVSLDGVDHPVLPLGGVSDRRIYRGAVGEHYCVGRLPGGFVRHLIQDIGKIMNGIDHLADVRQLESLDPGVERENLIVEDRVDANAIDVVGGVERMSLNVVRGSGQMEAEAFKQHDGCVDAGSAGGQHTFAKSIEESLIKSGKIKLRLA